jgi:hypothetical protein
MLNNLMRNRVHFYSPNANDGIKCVYQTIQVTGKKAEIQEKFDKQQALVFFRAKRMGKGRR